MDFHPIANIFPLMVDSEFKELVQDIEMNGLKQPILTHQNQIIDGRNRFLACSELGIDAPLKEWEDTGNLASYIISLNIHRRHLTPSQRAAISTEFMPYLEAEAKERQREAGKDHQGNLNNNPRLPQKVAEPDKTKNRDNESAVKAGAIFGANKQYVKDAKKIKQQSPEIFDAIKRGNINIPDAKKIAKLHQSLISSVLGYIKDGEPSAFAIQKSKREDARQTLEDIKNKKAKEIEGVYDVIVVDPPWPIKKIERDERPMQTCFDYPTMSLDEIKKLNIPCANNCHVWIWTTHKFLPATFHVLSEWNLKYVCTFVWHKPGGFQPVNLPQFNCEFAIYCRKGSPELLDTKNLPTCFNAARGAHSEKPEEFYNFVRRVTAGRRLDMFNRRQIEGFDGWGKEATSNEG